MYSYCEFKETLKEMVEEMVEDQNLKVRLDCVAKNNDHGRDVLIIYGESLSAAPSIGLEGLYQYYTECEEMDLVMGVVQDILAKEFNCGLLKIIKLWELARERIGIKLVNHELNENRLQELPHKQVLDLDMVCYINLFDQEDRASVEVKYSLLDMWKISEQELWGVAMENYSREKHVLRNMSNIMAEIVEDNVEESPMYVLTNESKVFGAVAMLDREMLKKFASGHGDIIILPSSIHEVILVPASELPDNTYIKEMIREINNTNVDPEEQLSNNYYYYDSSAGELKLM